MNYPKKYNSIIVFVIAIIAVFIVIATIVALRNKKGQQVIAGK